MKDEHSGIEDENDTYELPGTLENARYWHKRAEAAEARASRYEEALRVIRDVSPQSWDFYCRRATEALQPETCPTCGAYPSQRGTPTLVPFTGDVCVDSWHAAQPER